MIDSKNSYAAKNVFFIDLASPVEKTELISTHVVTSELVVTKEDKLKLDLSNFATSVLL
jgi:hypothetical protein